MKRLVIGFLILSSLRLPLSSSAAEMTHLHFKNTSLASMDKVVSRFALDHFPPSPLTMDHWKIIAPGEPSDHLINGELRSLIPHPGFPLLYIYSSPHDQHVCTYVTGRCDRDQSGSRRRSAAT